MNGKKPLLICRITDLWMENATVCRDTLNEYRELKTRCTLRANVESVKMIEQSIFIRYDDPEALQNALRKMSVERLRNILSTTEEIIEGATLGYLKLTCRHMRIAVHRKNMPTQYFPLGMAKRI